MRAQGRPAAGQGRLLVAQEPPAQPCSTDIRAAGPLRSRLANQTSAGSTLCFSFFVAACSHLAVRPHSAERRRAASTGMLAAHATTQEQARCKMPVRCPNPAGNECKVWALHTPYGAQVCSCSAAASLKRTPCKVPCGRPTNTRQEARSAPPLPHLCRHRHRLHPAARAVRPDAAIVLLQPRQLAEVSILPLLHQACPERRGGGGSW